MGVDFAKAALAAGHNVVASGRDPDAVADALGEADDLLVVKLDVTSRHDAETAVAAHAPSADADQVLRFLDEVAPLIDATGQRRSAERATWVQP